MRQNQAGQLELLAPEVSEAHAALSRQILALEAMDQKLSGWVGVPRCLHDLRVRRARLEVGVVLQAPRNALEAMASLHTGRAS